MNSVSASVGVVTAFYQALERGNAAALDALWIQDDRAGVVRPGGPLMRGYREIRAVLPSLFIPGSVAIQLQNFHEDQFGAVWRVTCVEELTVTIGGFQETVWSQATFLLADEGDGLRIVHHHASHVPGFDEQGPDELKNWNPFS
ncbi:MAG: nuclear transport factor 2 family protein [Chloroflexi bacterium]|nr:nuclear transport factor 2 family protein [Chloroflexota bacterium]